MANKKTSAKPRKSAKKSTPKKLKLGGVSFERYSPSESLAHTGVDEIGLVLGQALASGDKEAFQEILAGFIRARNISQIAEPKVLSRTSIYEAIDKNKDPRVGTVFKILAAIKKSDKISA
jgi:probable addiction module antidote protein